MMKRRRLEVLLIGVVLALLASTAVAGAQPPIQPDFILESDLTVQVDLVETMPSVNGPGVVVGTFGPNLGSPVTIKNKLYLIDQNDAIYRFNPDEGIQQIFNVSEAPDGLSLDNRQSILNISEGSRNDTVFVMFTSGSEPTTPTPIYRMPDPLPGGCCSAAAPIPLDDLYRIGELPFPLNFVFGATRTEYQVLYEFKVAGNKLKEPRAIAAFETQSGPTHNGGGMLTLPDGRVLFATADGLSFGADGRAAPQDQNEHVSKLLIIDPHDGSIEVAAQGIRNVQHLDFVAADGADMVAFGDIGGVTAEEINYVSVAALLDTTTIENFGWGRNADGLAREGTFYIQPGVPLVFATDPPVDAFAPSPEAGFIQPHAQYGRQDPNGGVAVTGPVASSRSFSTITGLFSDLASGIVYATTDPVTDTNVPVYKVNLLDSNGNTLNSLQDLVGGRADPRLFRFPDGTAGVLLEATGDFYRLTEVATD